jgi:hypothetical protein
VYFNKTKFFVLFLLLDENTVGALVFLGQLKKSPIFIQANTIVPTLHHLA